MCGKRQHRFSVFLWFFFLFRPLFPLNVFLYLFGAFSRCNVTVVNTEFNFDLVGQRFQIRGVDIDFFRRVLNFHIKFKGCGKQFVSELVGLNVFESDDFDTVFTIGLHHHPKIFVIQRIAVFGTHVDFDAAAVVGFFKAVTGTAVLWVLGSVSF